MIRLLLKKQAVSFQQGHLFPIIKAELFGRAVLMLVDSGSDLCYLDKSFFDSVEYKGEIKVGDIVITATGTAPTNGDIDTEIIIGNTLYELPMRIFPLKDRFESFGKTPAERPIGIIGANFLHVYHIVIDFDKRKLYL